VNSSSASIVIHYSFNSHAYHTIVLGDRESESEEGSECGASMLALRHATMTAVRRTMFPSVSVASAMLTGGGSQPRKMGTDVRVDLLPSNYTAAVAVSVIQPAAAAASTSIVLSPPPITVSSLLAERVLEVLENAAVWMVSTLKRRNRKMNKHKLRKRRKKNRQKNKKM
jgi:Mitochondrial domain of unknown function (DUF1713)